MEQKQHITTKSMVITGMFAAVLAVLSQIAIPMPSGVPVTLQTFAVALTGCVLGWKMGTVSVLVYVLIGAIGAPVFAGFSGGLGILLGKTGGFIFGFLFMAFFCGMGSLRKNKAIGGLLGALGVAICHLLGVLQFAVLMGMSFGESAVLVSLPYLVKDAVSVVLAFFAGAVLKKALNAANILSYAKA